MGKHGFRVHLPHHPVGSFPDVGEVAVPRPDVEGLPADQLRSRPGAGAAASRGRHRSCRHYVDLLFTTLSNKKEQLRLEKIYVCFYIRRRCDWNRALSVAEAFTVCGVSFLSVNVRSERPHHCCAVAGRQGRVAERLLLQEITEAVMWSGVFFFFLLSLFPFFWAMTSVAFKFCLHSFIPYRIWWQMKYSDP